MGRGGIFLFSESAFLKKVFSKPLSKTFLCGGMTLLQNKP
jgi:hypothetical protein